MFNKKVNIVVACDNHYMVLLAALVKSIELHSKPQTQVHIYIIGNNISASSKSRLAGSISSRHMVLHWKTMKEVIPKGISLPLDRSAYPLDIYMRLFIPYFMPDEAEKVLYLDVDMIVQKDIAEIFSTDLGNNVLGAVMDPRVKTFDNSWGGILNYAQLGFEPKTSYFNTGLLLMNLPAWRKEHITEKVFRCIEENTKHAQYPDQYGLNIVLAGKWLELDTRWNHFADVNLADPYLIHFISRKPIYQTYSNQPAYRAMFFKYLEQTKWKGFRPIGESNRYFKILKNVVKKLAAKFKVSTAALNFSR